MTTEGHFDLQLLQYECRLILDEVNIYKGGNEQTSFIIQRVESNLR